MPKSSRKVLRGRGIGSNCHFPRWEFTIGISLHTELRPVTYFLIDHKTVTLIHPSNEAARV